MTAVNHPALPAVFDYPTQSSHAGELDAAHKLFLEELASPEADWEDQGERDGVQLWSKKDPEVRCASHLPRKTSSSRRTATSLCSRTGPLCVPLPLFDVCEAH